MKARLYYFSKQTQVCQQRAFDRVYRDTQYITRANEPGKVLADNALLILTNLVAMLQASPGSRIFVSQDWLAEVTGRSSDQNSNLLKQLQDIIQYRYYRVVRFEEKRYHYVYVVQFTKEGEARVTNPADFYSMESRNNSVRRGKKFGQITEKIRASYIREIEREQEEPYGYSSCSPVPIKTRARAATR